MAEVYTAVHSGDQTARWMLDAALALLPACCGALWFGGWAAAKVLLSAVLACLGAEWALGRLRRANWRDGSALVSGLLLALLLPSSCPWWCAALGGLGAMLAKAVSGGLGRNIFDPAALGRVLLLAFGPLHPAPLREAEGTFLLGYTGGSLGECSSLLLLLGAVYLLIRRRLPPQIAGTALVAAFLAGLGLPNCDALALLAWGGTWLTACFLASDPVSSPLGLLLQALYGAACGVCCTLCAYYWGGIAGSCAALLALNLIFRALERLTIP